MTPKPLYDANAELAVLGAIALRNEAIDEVIDLLEPSQFGREHHRHVFAAMVKLHQTGKAIDVLTLKAELERAGHMETVTLAFLMALGDGVPRSVNIAHYAQIVRDKALLRDLRTIAGATLSDAEAEILRGEELLERLEAEVYRLSSTAIRTDWVTAEDLATELYPVIERMSNAQKAISGIPSGLPDLDRLTRGWQPGDLILVGARPSIGKSALAMQWAMSAALRADAKPVAVFSLEMGREQVGLRAVVSEARVDGYRMMTGFLNDMDRMRVSDGLATLSNAAIAFDESASLSPVQVRSKLRRLRAKQGALGLVVIDYLQLMAPLPDQRKENRQTQVAGISRALKILAREFNVPFIVLSQLNRGLERSTDKTPSLSDLRESGALEQDADVVLLIHRPEVYEDDPSLEGAAQLILAKHRNGPIGKVELVWLKQFMRFESEAR